MKVYVIMAGEYSDTYCAAVAIDKEDAELKEKFLTVGLKKWTRMNGSTNI